MKPALSPASIARQTADLIRAGRFIEAIAHAQRLLALDPDNERAIELLATAQINAGRPADARAHLEKHAPRHPHSARLR